MSRPAVSVTVILLLVVVLSTTATRPTHAEWLQDLHKEETTRGAVAASWMEADQPLSTIWTAEKKDGGRDDAVTMESSKPSGGGGAAPSSGGNASGESGEHGKEGSSSSSKEGEKSAAGSRSCLSKEECHKKRLLCGKGCTLSAHTKCAAKCSKSCVPTC